KSARALCRSWNLASCLQVVDRPVHRVAAKVSGAVAAHVNAWEPKANPRFPARRGSLSAGPARGVVGSQIGVFGMPLDVRVDECTLGDQLAAIAPDVIEGGPGELRAVALAFVLRGHLGVSEGAHAVAILV